MALWHFLLLTRDWSMCHHHRQATPPSNCDRCFKKQSFRFWPQPLSQMNSTNVSLYHLPLHTCLCFNRCVADSVFLNDLASGCSLSQRSRLFKGFFQMKCVWSAAREGREESCRCSMGKHSKVIPIQSTLYVPYVKQSMSVCVVCVYIIMHEQREREMTLALTVCVGESARECAFQKKTNQCVCFSHTSTSTVLILYSSEGEQTSTVLKLLLKKYLIKNALTVEFILNTVTFLSPKSRRLSAHLNWKKLQ